jgi:hypothetical protein
VSLAMRRSAYTTGNSPRHCVRAIIARAALGCFATSEANAFEGTAPEADIAAEAGVLLVAAPLSALSNAG